MLPDRGMRTERFKLDKETKRRQKKALKARIYAIANLRQAALCGEATLINMLLEELTEYDVGLQKCWPHGRLWITVQLMNDYYHGTSTLDYMQFQSKSTYSKQTKLEFLYYVNNIKI
mmetsp:Transcript_28364/g.61031  ORF Transcript_28364/g.61031 Transcript_28364/m.61031 type:complete len:117 (-) Transcript_28364:7-357(-)